MATSLSPLQVSQVRQIVGGGISLDAVKTRLDALSPEETAETVEDINDWLKVRKDFTEISGGRSGVKINPKNDRFAIRNYVRERLFPGMTFIEESTNSSSYAVYTAPVECKKF
jgi:hypothetical protein